MPSNDLAWSICFLNYGSTNVYDCTFENHWLINSIGLILAAVTGIEHVDSVFDHLSTMKIRRDPIVVSSMHIYRSCSIDTWSDDGENVNDGLPLLNCREKILAQRTGWIGLSVFSFRSHFFSHIGSSIFRYSFAFILNTKCYGVRTISDTKLVLRARDLLWRDANLAVRQQLRPACPATLINTNKVTRMLKLNILLARYWSYTCFPKEGSILRQDVNNLITTSFFATCCFAARLEGSIEKSGLLQGWVIFFSRLLIRVDV